MYKKMIHYHNIMNSEVDRLSRRILMFQKEEKRTGTWFMSTREIAEQCGQINTFDQVLELSKDEWKKIWKETIWKKDEMSVRERAKGMTKMRTVEATTYGRKRYVTQLKPEEVGVVLRMKLHMTKLLANFTNKGEERSCRVCNEEDETDEHMMECRKVKNMWKHMNLNRSYIESENVKKT